MMEMIVTDPIELTFSALAVLRSALLLAMAVAALRLLWRVQVRPSRRSVNPSIRWGLLLVGSAGAALSAHNLRLLLMTYDPEGSWLWVLLARDPDVVGEIGSSLWVALTVIGVLILIRGVRATLYRGEPGELPRALRGKATPCPTGPT